MIQEIESPNFHMNTTAYLKSNSLERYNQLVNVFLRQYLCRNLNMEKISR